MNDAAPRMEVAVVEGIGKIAREEWNSRTDAGRLAVRRLGLALRDGGIRAARRARPDGRRIIWWSATRRQNRCSPPARSTSRATAWASSCSITDGPTRPSAPESATTPSCWSGCRSRRIPGAAFLTAPGADRFTLIYADRARADRHLHAITNSPRLHVNFLRSRRSRGARADRLPGAARLSVSLAERRLRDLRRLSCAAQA